MIIRRYIPNHTVCKEFTVMNTGRKMHVIIRLFTNNDGTDQIYKIDTSGDDNYIQRMGFAGAVLGHWLATENPGKLEEPEYPFVYFEEMDRAPGMVTQYKLYPLLVMPHGLRYFLDDNSDMKMLLDYHETTWIPESEVAMIED